MTNVFGEFQNLIIFMNKIVQRCEVDPPFFNRYLTLNFNVQDGTDYSIAVLYGIRPLREQSFEFKPQRL